ncbi:hypothetical protein [Endozoicomonas numazuensis]|uniref:Uncharacterized protein n=1 Tax=Endozoicomonas numazuensis TaxID=1137799 RepID=A0A081NIS6_9GAMM|nr:hypothetical protein [Endozoicomonas numazuensis]KEQ18349.1 hypothetical protein GZ78_12630 [Endozoicomonas numazuensis]
MFRFDHHSNLVAWEESEERQNWLTQLQPLLEKKLQYKKNEGMELWFDLPDIPPKTIPRYKMAMVTLLAVYPLFDTILLSALDAARRNTHFHNHSHQLYLYLHTDDMVRYAIYDPNLFFLAV